MLNVLVTLIERYAEGFHPHLLGREQVAVLGAFLNWHGGLLLNESLLLSDVPESVRREWYREWADLPWVPLFDTRRVTFSSEWATASRIRASYGLINSADAVQLSEILISPEKEAALLFFRDRLGFFWRYLRFHRDQELNDVLFL